MNSVFNVHCSKCQEFHDVNDVEFLNIEEDYIGRDIMHFLCPKTIEETKSLVYKQAY